MNVRVVMAVTCCAVLGAGCLEVPDEDRPMADAPIDPSDREFAEALERWRQRQEPWENRGGRMICRGYLSRVETDEFCSADRPPDWQPFDYQGETYFVQPLAGRRADGSARDRFAR